MLNYIFQKSDRRIHQTKSQFNSIFQLLVHTVNKKSSKMCLSSNDYPKVICEKCSFKGHMAENCPRSMKSTNMSKQIHAPKRKVLEVKILDKVSVPNILYEKHISKQQLTTKIAIDLSQNRKQSDPKTGEIFTNTVFENPKRLVKCKVLNQKNFLSQVIFVSEEMLKSFKCKKDQKTREWSAKENEQCYAVFAGKNRNFHLLTEFLGYDVKFVCNAEE